MSAPKVIAMGLKPGDLKITGIAGPPPGSLHEADVTILKGQRDEFMRRATSARCAMECIRKAYERGDMDTVEHFLTKHTAFNLGPVARPATPEATPTEEGVA